MKPLSSQRMTTVLFVPAWMALPVKVMILGNKKATARDAVAYIFG